MTVKLKKVKDKRKLPPNVTIKILNREEKIKLKREMTDKIKFELNKEEEKKSHKNISVEHNQ